MAKVMDDSIASSIVQAGNQQARARCPGDTYRKYYKI
jgi:hypothetical protein